MVNVSKTHYAENQTIDRVFANSAPAGATDGVTVALYSVSPANDPDQTNEVTGDGYAAQNVTASGWSLTASTNNPREYDNDAEIDFGTLDSSTSKWVNGTVLYEPTDDTSTANAVYYGDLDTNKDVSAGDEFKFNAGDLTVNED